MCFEVSFMFMFFLLNDGWVYSEGANLFGFGFDVKKFQFSAFMWLDVYHGFVHEGHSNPALQYLTEEDGNGDAELQTNIKLKIEPEEKPAPKPRGKIKQQGKNTKSSIRDKLTVRLRRSYSGLPKRDCSYIGAWLRRSGYVSVGVCTLGVNKLERLVISELAGQRDVRLKWLMTNQEKTPNVLWKVATYSLASFDHSCLDGIDAIVVCNPVDEENIKRVFKELTKADIICVNSIVQALRNYEETYHLIERLHHLQLKGIQTLVMEMPVVTKVKNPSVWEQILISNEWCCGNPIMNNFSMYFPISGLDDKYTYELFENGSLRLDKIRYKDYAVCKDKKNTYVNIRKHIRPAIGIPANSLHDVHIIGDSTAEGAFLRDEHTVATQLQIVMNEKQREQKKDALFSTLTYAAAAISAKMLHNRLRDVAVNHGDIVVVCGARFKFDFLDFKRSCIENGVPVYKIQFEFDRPHFMGEVFLSGGHLNGNGNRRVGEILYDKLFSHPLKLPVLDRFIHYYCEDSRGKPKFMPAFSESLQIDGTKNELSTNSRFVKFIRDLETYHGDDNSQVMGAIVMNCNPFTLGHLYLIEVAAAQVNQLFIFVVEEDLSAFPFTDRLNLVELGTSHLPNVVVSPSSRFIISTYTLPEYFVKGENPNAFVDSSTDLEIFCRWVAPALKLHTRFVGEEPFDRITLQYNKAMQNTLPQCGVRLQIIPRKVLNDTPISASLVRTFLKDGEWDNIAMIVPDSTLVYLVKKYMK